MNRTADFNYEEAFSRNLGWVTAAEQEQLRRKRIAIAGLGGVGGHYLLTAVRAGIGAFHIADFDRFETANFNRQVGATVSHLGHAKVEVMAGMAREINPELTIKSFAAGVTADNLDLFLEDVDLCLDGLDFFALDARRLLFAACYERGIPAITAAPMGMGVAWLIFEPGRMSFEDYFCLEGHSRFEQMLRFVIGLSPRPLQVKYLIDPSRVDLINERVPSTPMAANLCAGVTVTEALKRLLNRGPIVAAPHSQQFDVYRNRFIRNYRPFGNRNPLQKLGLRVLRQNLSPGLVSDVSDQKKTTLSEKILDQARWAPSGDNAQPWRFRIHDDTHFTILQHNGSERNVYDLKGWAEPLSFGALLENIVIAARGEGYQARFIPQLNGSQASLKIDVTLSPHSAPRPHPLRPYLQTRTTQRHSLKTTPLKSLQQAALEEAVLPDYEVLWLDSRKQKKQMARICSLTAQIRLTIPEAYRIHKSIIEWNTRFSRDRIPDHAIGLDPVTRCLMRWLLGSWQRVRFANRFLAGTVLPRLQLDYLPALRCAGHFVLLATQAPQETADYLKAGRTLQRFWLTATKEQIQLQPQLAPLMFSYYARAGIAFSEDRHALSRAEQLSQQLDSLIGTEQLSRAVFMGRVGYGPAPTARSLRKPLAELLV